MQCVFSGIVDCADIYIYIGKSVRFLVHGGVACEIDFLCRYSGNSQNG